MGVGGGARVAGVESPGDHRHRNWPDSNPSLGRQLGRIRPLLADNGVNFERSRDSSPKRDVVYVFKQVK